jgi:hypothetical protein
MAAKIPIGLLLVLLAALPLILAACGGKGGGY